MVYVSEREKTKTSIKIDPVLWKEVKIEAIRRNLTVSDFLEETLKKELDFKGSLRK